MLVSNGFNMVPGEAAYLMLRSVFPSLAGTSLRANERLTGELEPILRLAQQKNILIHTIDSRGLYTIPLYSASEAGATPRIMQVIGGVLDRAAQSAGDTLQEIAAATGGTVFRNRNDLLTGMERAFADGRDYYLLAYESTNRSQKDQFRKISIKMDDNKLKTSAKSGYWGN